MGRDARVISSARLLISPSETARAVASTIRFSSTVRPKPAWADRRPSTASGAKRASATAFALTASRPRRWPAASSPFFASDASPSRILPARTCAVSAPNVASSSRMPDRTEPMRSSAPARLVTREMSGVSGMRALLQLQELAVDLAGDADAAGLRDAAGVFLDQHRAVDRAAGAVVAERPLRAARREHPLEGLLEEHRLEILGGLFRLVGRRG